MFNGLLGAVAIIAAILLGKMIWERREKRERIEQLVMQANAQEAQPSTANILPCTAAAPSMIPAECAEAVVSPHTDLFPGSYSGYGMYNTACLNSCSSRKRSCH